MPFDCRFTRAVEGLLRISDYHRREQLQAIHLARQARTGNLKTSSVPEGVEEDGEGKDSENESESGGEREGEGTNERTRLLAGHDQKPYRASDSPSSRDDPSHAFWDLPQVSYARLRLIDMQAQHSSGERKLLMIFCRKRLPEQVITAEMLLLPRLLSTVFQ